MPATTKGDADDVRDRSLHRHGTGDPSKWDEALNSTLDLSPKKYAFDADPPVMPKKDGSYPIPVPGETDVLKG